LSISQSDHRAGIAAVCAVLMLAATKLA